MSNPPRSYTLLDIVRDSFRCYLGHELSPKVMKYSFSNLLGYAATVGKVEIEQIYTDHVIWNNFLLMDSRCTMCLFVADSGSKVNAVIEKRRFESKLKQWFPDVANDLRCTLNSDKLAVQELPIYSGIGQYRKLFALQWRELGNRELSTSKRNLLIKGLHSRSGGRFRSLYRDLNSRSFIDTLPRAGSVEYFVLDFQISNVIMSGTFDTASATEAELEKWIR